MARTFSRAVLVLGIFSAVMASGCDSAQTSRRFSAGVSPALVMATAPESTTWEYRRNDGPLNAGRPPIAGAGWVEVRTYDRRRKLLLNGLREIGLPVPVDPQGAFYVLVDARHLDSDSYRLAFDILQRVGVAVTPGIDFGPSAEGHLRFSYANSSENLSEGIRRLSEYIREVTHGDM